MIRTFAVSVSAQRALELVELLQARFRSGLESLGGEDGYSRFHAVEWVRDEGRHGGGVRFACGSTEVFNSASINVSQVHYDDLPDKRLASATALSTIIHPRHPLAPSVHMHISWTELRGGGGYWRVMADLNPAIEQPLHTERFFDCLRESAGELFDSGRQQGERYFYIPALGRHRGVAHFYLESYATGNAEADLALARSVGERVTREYVAMVGETLARVAPPTEDEIAQQLAYHTLYLFQVCTLDRGTTSGLMVHDQNDVGIMASIPARVDRQLLASWESRAPEVQRPLVRGLLGALPGGHPSPVTDAVRLELARVIREHYRAHPEALELQARGDVVPPTVANHRG